MAAALRKPVSQVFLKIAAQLSDCRGNGGTVSGMKRRIIASIASTTVMTALAVLGISGTAQAAVTEFCTQPFAKAGFACFYSYGDKFKVTDNYKDGLRAVVIWATDYGRSGECHDADGADNGYTWCNYDFKENQLVFFAVVARDGANGKDQYPTATVIGHTSGR
ncbi:hypothetical protein GCM10022225_65730 [Plantactinospora mayteni]|uniref:Uncharacterized protein n=1 Tax=Plantactinospora mayteni TaxID=566021 RepID=A0ABQ4EPN5_9ACTN|nr:hypothetical protein [Plantactinospora mayteni]GIG96646.1 hypothetical protein Pma05_32190 [Plantactinospora mayteni]